MRAPAPPGPGTHDYAEQESHLLPDAATVELLYLPKPDVVVLHYPLALAKTSTLLAAELSPISHSGLGVVSSSLFRGGVSASEISAMRLVDGIGYRIRGAKNEMVGSGGDGVGASSSAGTKSLGCSGSGMYTGTWSAGTYSGERGACSRKTTIVRAASRKDSSDWNTTKIVHRVIRSICNGRIS
ncbi:hypothetical protein Tco_0652315 [Tanacetum coccineum]|uniref:Uncharacterized protein n=1 Tax=Tanacetum coccineum TaxID=301880 RepID=A0ABQ4WX97_9ASTR